MMKRQTLIMTVLAGALMTGACSEQERREVREKEVRIAAEQAKQQRILNQHVAELSAETQRRRAALSAETMRRKHAQDAETQRQFDHQMTIFGRFAALITGIAGFIGWVVFCVRRIAEKHTEERTKRHEQNLNAIVADKNLKPDHRNDLYGRAIEAANKGGTPLIGYQPKTGDAS